MPYHLYCIELDREVLDVRRFSARNPDHREDKPCVYVGSTALDPEERFRQHKKGYKANRYALKFGVRLRPRNTENYGPFDTREEAETAEAKLASRLRKKGYAVWFG